MAQYDLLIKGGLIVDGTRMPAYRGDIGIRAGRVAEMGRVTGDATRVIDATGLVVAPGFIDIHTHYDAALSGWDPYATLSGWHGVTTVAIGNCGFGFAPVRPEDQERAMLRMERTETIPLSVMQASMRWDWVTFPEFLASLERHRIGVNVASLVPYIPIRAWVMGNEASRDPEYTPKAEEVAEAKQLLWEALQAGGFGFSATFSPSNRDYDGGYLPTHVTPREEYLEMAEVLREFGRGSMEWTMGTSVSGLNRDFFVEMAKTSGRPLSWNLINYEHSAPDRWREQLAWSERAFKEALVFPINLCVPQELEFTLETIGMFDDVPALSEATVGTREERKAKLADPQRRPAIKRDIERKGRGMFTPRLEDGEAGQLNDWRPGESIIAEVALVKNQHLVGTTVEEMAAKLDKHPVDAILDLAVEEDLKTEFSLPADRNVDEEAVMEILRHPLSLVGSSDGGAHTKFLTLGRYPTHFLSHWVRDRQVMSLEEAHWRLSTMIGWAIGIRDRGWLREGMPADIVVYDREKLQVLPMETLHDLPNGDWRRVQKASGYQFTIVNGVITFEGQRCTGELPGSVLRSYE